MPIRNGMIAAGKPAALISLKTARRYLADICSPPQVGKAVALVP
jgi:hypothetical protein